ncbi:FAD:protein FMN transferase [Tissierella sp. MSJ-40]|uniref:FAD:protein FMN transferase n=1 Tax=Tissierella simiarum TaxID=2841534 RepID=A0ABS6EB60_9FIRM|nr:FAD:protein FMN transferase [Tissierella simiarum]MBU5440022.1 FAD:protein FMN transferase [Tissierella simiarum]
MKFKKVIVPSLIIATLLILTGCSTKKSANFEPISKTDFLMDTVVTIKIYDKNDEKIMDKVFDRLKEIENRMSATIDSSDVNRVNQEAGINPVEVHDDVYYVIKTAKYYAEISKGAYDPTIGPLVELWNIKGDEKERDLIPSDKEIKEKKALVDYKKLEILEDNKVFLKEKGMKINLGGIVKGYAADEVKRILIENEVNSAIIDLGGNIYALGEKTDGSQWKIGIQNPFEFTGNYLGILEVKDKTIVTSGDYERYFEHNGKRYHHIIDVKTGYPTDNEVTGVSIVSDKSIDGDALSTTLFVLGVDEGMKLVNSLNGVEAIFISKDKIIHIPSKLDNNFKLKEGNSNFNIKEY